MATGPQKAVSPLEHFTNDGTREMPFLSKIYLPTVCGAIGFVGATLGNWALKRPYFSGIQYHILLTAGLATFGKYYDDYRNGMLAERDAIYRHYIQLHPEDFPTPERKTYAQVLEHWTPIR